jgi:hypothetical protein
MSRGQEYCGRVRPKPSNWSGVNCAIAGLPTSSFAAKFPLGHTSSILFVTSGASLLNLTEVSTMKMDVENTTGIATHGLDGKAFEY